jgi:hypothetical protein
MARTNANSVLGLSPTAQGAIVDELHHMHRHYTQATHWAQLFVAIYAHGVGFGQTRIALVPALRPRMTCQNQDTVKTPSRPRISFRTESRLTGFRFLDLQWPGPTTFGAQSVAAQNPMVTLPALILLTPQGSVRAKTTRKPTSQRFPAVSMAPRLAERQGLPA